MLLVFQPPLEAAIAVFPHPHYLESYPPFGRYLHQSGAVALAVLLYSGVNVLGESDIVLRMTPVRVWTVEVEQVDGHYLGVAGGRFVVTTQNCRQRLQATT